MAKLPNIKFTGDISKFVEAKDNPDAFISYEKDADYFLDGINYSKFVKGVEKMVRTSKEYSVFTGIIKNVYGLNFCQVFSNITESNGKVHIDMHHGPIFTLYDISAVVTNDYLNRGKPVTTMRIANDVIQLHYDEKVQVVMLARTPHEAVHNRDIFLNVKQGFGNVDAFIKEYTNALDDEQKYKIWHYVNICENNPSFDMGILDTEYVKKYIKL